MRTYERGNIAVEMDTMTDLMMETEAETGKHMEEK